MCLQMLEHNIMGLQNKFSFLNEESWISPGCGTSEAPYAPEDGPTTIAPAFTTKWT